MQAVRLMLLTSGLVTLRFTWSQGVHTGRCSYAGVVHLEGSGKYSLNYQQAVQLCRNQGYSLATEDQLTKAYSQGLKTCRYGWIEDQKTSFLPHNADPDCTFNSTGVTSHAEEEDQLYDVYCFTHTDSLEVICEGAATPTSVHGPSTPSEPTTTVFYTAENVLDEVIADGFIVDTKVATTTPVRNESSDETYTTATTPNSLNLDGRSSQPPTQEDTSITTSITTVLTDPEMTTEEPKTDNSSTSEITQTSPTVTPDQATTATSETTATQTVSAAPGITERDATVHTTTQEPIQNFLNVEVEGSGMSSETLYEKNPEDPINPTSVNTRVRELESMMWFPEFIGSGMEPKVDTSVPDRTQKPAVTVAVEVPELEVEEGIVAVEKPKTEAEVPVQHKGRINLPEDPQPTTSARAEEGTPGWLIIFAFCMTLGAILCVFAGIATKDKWYGPSRRSLNITPTDESSKAATLPLSEKEQELVTLMNGGQKTDKDSAVISVDEAPEKEYLM